MNDKQNKIIEKIAQKYSLELILLFGSRAEGKAHKKSDFDVAYSSEKKLTLEEESQMIVDLFPIFESENIDLVNLEKAPPLLFYAVFKDAKVIYEKMPSTFSSLRAYAFKKYVETKPLYNEKFSRLEKQVELIK